MPDARAAPIGPKTPVALLECVGATSPPTSDEAGKI
jgi:hypothetical protein